MPSDASQAKQIFLEAVEEHAPDQWGRFLDEACGGDAALRDHVRALLEAYRQPNRLLDDTGVVVAPPRQIIAEAAGAVIGPYQLLQEIGEGGMGVVFAAEQQQPMRRKVALKIIKPGMDTKEVIARFDAERQALALMDHPNIARVFDAGATDSGRPYFVMELIEGIPINAYCDQHDLPPQQRLELFLSVCHAVQHAHQKGIIHRDVKPTNILVTLHDGQPVVKVIDFGVAKAINRPLTEKTLFTAQGQMLGTPQYMSPEQTESSGGDVDTRSDVYSLGVLLYELLTGSTPLQAERMREAGYAEIQRMIRDEEPQRPSLRLSTAGEQLTAVARHRSIDPARLRRLVQGELDWIVMKTLEKERSRRYDTVASLAADIQRFLNGEAVEACPPSVFYRFRKLVTRHKVAVTTTTLIGLALVVGMAATLWQAARAARLERDHAISMLNLAIRASADVGQARSAERLFEELTQRGYGSHPETLRTAPALAKALQKEDRLEDAVRLLRRVHEVQQRILGVDHIDTRQTAAGMLVLSEACFNRAWLLSTPADGSEHELCPRSRSFPYRPAAGSFVPLRLGLHGVLRAVSPRTVE